ncbi:hypothetical protein LIER_16454 [Lithospermum erythrorhizon]|uniref:RNase H type-1 domain-containing protein n=1 Tax=Lithospermum erythrorhizon TaxID=34254 RepID=A0AAV3QC30_LITER
MFSVLTLIAKAQLTHPKYSRGESGLASIIRVRFFEENAKAPRVISWTRENTNALKLNIDVAYKDGVVGLGGIIRKHGGSMLMAMNFKGTSSTPLEAELEAIIQCLQ